MRGGLSILTAALTLCLSASASAQVDDDERARLHFESGTAYYDAGDYDNALREFQSAFDLSGRTGLLYNLYLCHERLGNLDEGVTALAGYLEAEDVGDRRAVLETRLANLRERADRARTEAEAETEIETETDAHTETETEPFTDREQETSSGGVPVPAVIAFGVAGAGAVTWAIFGILAASENGRLGDECALVACTEDDVSSLRTFNVVADIGFALTLAGAAAGALLWLLLDGDDAEGSASITPYVDDSGGGLVARGRL